jgi:hypothetical protein
MKVIALVRAPESIARYLRRLACPPKSRLWLSLRDLPALPLPHAASPRPSPARGPPFWQSRVLRRRYGEPPDAGQA